MKDAVNKVSLFNAPDFDFTKLSIQELQDLVHRYGVIGSRYMNKEDLIVKKLKNLMKIQKRN